MRVQLWLKRVREHLDRKKGERIRFIAVAEYGSRKGRLHYHLLLFVAAEVVKRDLPPWEHGHYQYRLSNQGAMKYITKYITKDGVKIRASQKMGAESAAKVECHASVVAVQAAFPGAYIKSVRYGGRSVALPKTQLHARQSKEEKARREEFLAAFRAVNRIDDNNLGPSWPREDSSKTDETNDYPDENLA